MRISSRKGYLIDKEKNIPSFHLRFLKKNFTSLHLQCFGETFKLKETLSHRNLNPAMNMAKMRNINGADAFM